MKLVINREKLLEPLQLACGVVEKRQTSPILSNLLLQTEAGRVVIVGSDQEVEVTVELQDVTVTETGEVTVPGRKLLDICRSLPENAELSLNLEGNRVAADSGRFSSHLATLPAEDFPFIDFGVAETTIALARQDLSRLLQRTTFAMAQQDVRYFFNGVLLEVANGQVRFVATNGQRLATSFVSLEASSGSHQYIIPRKAVIELARIISDGRESAVSLEFTSNHMRVIQGHITLITKLIDATYPDYSRAIPGGVNPVDVNPVGVSKVVTVDRLVLKEALTRTAILSNELYRNVRLLFAADKLDMHANNPQQEEAEESISIEYTGPELEIGFNVSYLIEVLSVMEGDIVRLTLTDPGSPCLIEDPDEGESLFVISPMVL